MRESPLSNPWAAIRRWGGAIAALVVIAQPAPATVAIQTTVPRMVKVSDLVVEGTVIGFAARDGLTEAQGEMCPAVELRYTEITLDVQQVYKGRLSHPQLIVRVLGGEEEEGVLRRTYLPFRRGERMLLFLQMNGEDDFPFPGFHQGIYRFRRSEPGNTMPDPDTPSGPCSTCTPSVLDGRDHLVRRVTGEGFVHSWNARQRPGVMVVVGPGQALVPAEETPEANSGVLPRGAALPQELVTPGEIRQAVRAALGDLGLPADPPPLGDPGSPLADELMPGDPIVRCGTPALLSDEDEAFEIVPGGDHDPPIEEGPSETTSLKEKQP